MVWLLKRCYELDYKEEKYKRLWKQMQKDWDIICKKHRKAQEAEKAIREEA